MNSAEILEILKSLVLELAAGKRNKQATVDELHRRIDPALVYNMAPVDPLRDIITQVYVSLENLTARDFPPSASEMQYILEYFEGKREFRLAEIREFAVESLVEEAAPLKKQQTDRKARPGAANRKYPNRPPRTGRINPFRKKG